jgi:hypothetical protein
MEKVVKSRKLNISMGSIRNILGGSFLTNDKTTKNLPYLLFLAFLAIIYIGNSYYAEKNIRKVERLQKELRELRYKHISTKSQLMQRTRQSKVASILSTKGIKESTVPPKKVIEMN